MAAAMGIRVVVEIPGPGAFGVVDGLLKALIGQLDMTAV
jgi:hypothetical protein